TAPASTGMTAISKKAVISQLHTNMGIFIRPMPGARRLNTVTITLMAPMIEEMPMMCTATIRKSVLAGPYWVESGAYMVQPKSGAAGWPGKKALATIVPTRMMAANGSIQKDQLFMRG